MGHKHKKILFINDHLRKGGVATVTNLLAEAFQSSGHEVQICTFYDSDDRQYVESLHINRWQRALILPVIYKISRYLIKHKPEVVISSKDFVNVWVVICKILLKPCLKFKLIVNSHTNVEIVWQRGWRSAKVALFLAKFLYKYADIVANVSQGASKASEKFFGLNKVHTLYNPVGINDTDGDVISHPFFNKDYKTIIACGRLADAKDYPKMLDVFAKAFAEDSSLRLVILGDGPLKEVLIKKAAILGLEECVNFVGNTTEPKQYMKQADLFWLTSKYEGFGIVIVEALSVGTKVLSTNCKYGPDEILAAGKYGVLVSESVTTGEYARLLLDSLNESKYFSKQSLIARAREFSSAKIANDYLQVLKD